MGSLKRNSYILSIATVQGNRSLIYEFRNFNLIIDFMAET